VTRLLPVTYAGRRVPAWSTLGFDWERDNHPWRQILWWRGERLVQIGFWTENYNAYLRRRR
jgi:hypothetical protein